MTIDDGYMFVRCADFTTLPTTSSFIDRAGDVGWDQFSRASKVVFTVGLQHAWSHWGVPGPGMKVFLSHSTKDKEFVQALATELKAEKIEPWICEVDVEFGGNFVCQNRGKPARCGPDNPVLVA